MAQIWAAGRGGETALPTDVFQRTIYIVNRYNYVDLQMCTVYDVQNPYDAYVYFCSSVLVRPGVAYLLRMCVCL